MLTRLRPLWGDEGKGTIWLAIGIATTFVFGLALQVLGLHRLGSDEYATFVFALGLGNVANAIAAAIQPVIATRSATGDPTFLPAPPRVLAAGVAMLMLLAVGTLGRSVGALIALAAVSQIPLHALVAVGHGRLQARRAFARLATGLGIWSVARILIVAVMMMSGSAPEAAFVIALPAALLTELALLIGLGAYRGVRWHAAADSGRLFSHYALWALFAWIVNADAVYARLFLSAADAGKYAIAVTLGRQPIYAVAPLAIVLLPVTLNDDAVGQRRRLYAILMTSLLLLVGTWAVLGIRPQMLVDLLAGTSGRADSVLIRGYALLGSLIAAATLLLTFVFALRHAPRTRALAGMAIVYLCVAAAFVHDPRQLLSFQLLAVGPLVLHWAYLGVRATARARRPPHTSEASVLQKPAISSSLL